MRELRLIADDLTGALDSGCAFANPERPVLVGLPWRPLPQGPRLAVSTETRNGSRQEATRIVADMVLRLRLDASPDSLWFKKVDSVLRGHPFSETAAVLDAGGFGRCVFAPAFPEMGRVTTGGRQHAAAAETAALSPVGPVITEAFRLHGLDAEIVDFEDDALRTAPDSPVLVIEARTQDELRRRVSATAARLQDNALWVGSGGLAAALSDALPAPGHPPVRCVIVGTRHPVTLAQVERLLEHGVVAEPAEDAASALPLLVAPSRTTSSAEETQRRLDALVPRIDIGNPRESTIVVTGGDTLSAVLRAVDADFLECHGQVLAGVPASRIRGGRWHGVTVLSKSGGFGAPDLLAVLCR